MSVGGLYNNRNTMVAAVNKDEKKEPKTKTNNCFFVT